MQPALRLRSVNTVGIALCNNSILFAENQFQPKDMISVILCEQAIALQGCIIG
ncbi:MAG: hypothetical protein V7K77_26955 [Nostoc sp.]|uniref:hypothetical protein n=1 Tax=Nostoc sp. TaxID=1180 RepID=UPI002FFD4EEB